jgi:hypothetical protein
MRKRDHEKLESILDHLRALLICEVAEIRPVIDRKKLAQDIKWLEEMLK